MLSKEDRRKKFDEENPNWGKQSKYKKWNKEILKEQSVQVLKMRKDGNDTLTIANKLKVDYGHVVRIISELRKLGYEVPFIRPPSMSEILKQISKENPELFK